MNQDSPNPRRFFSIQSKLITYLLIISIIPLVIMGIFSMYSSITPLKQFALAPIHNHVLSITNQIRQELYDVREDVLYLSRLPDMARMLEFYQESAPGEQLKLTQDVVNDFIELVTKRKKYHFISYINERGKEIIRINFSKPDQWKVVFGENLQNKADVPFFTEGMKLNFGQVYVSTVTLNEEYGILETPYTRVLYISTPVEDILKQKKGVITIALNADVLFKPIHEWKVEGYRDASTFIINKSGFYLAHSDKQKEWGQQQVLKMEWSIVNDLPKEISAKLLSDSLDTLIDDKKANLIFLKSRCYPEFINPTNYWLIVASVPRNKVYASINRFNQVFVGLLLLTMLTTCLFAILLATQFTKPIKLLRNGATLIRDGNLSHRIDLQSSDEIGELAYDFNLMASELEGLYKNLENKVKERTELLQKAMEDLKEKDQLIQEADRLKLDFLTNLSVELRTPLTSVMGYIALLINNVYGDLNDRQTETLIKARKNLYHTFKWLDGIVRISSLSALQMDKITTHLTEFNLVESIIQSVNSVNYALEENEISITYDFNETDSFPITSDKEKCDEILSSVLNGIVHHRLTKDIKITAGIQYKQVENIEYAVICFNLSFPQNTEIDDLYRALIEPFIHSHSFLNITNLSTNVARSLLTVMGGKLGVDSDKKSNSVILKIFIRKGGVVYET